MLTQGSVQQIMKHSMAYGFVISQPFSYYVDAYPMLQNEVLAQAKELEYGEHSDAVRVLQHKLNQLSYYDKEIDGEYGVLTEYALKKFQYEHDLTVTGQADIETLSVIKRVEKEKYLQPLTSIKETYHPGDKGEDIAKLQEALYYFGYYKAEVDGIYGPITDQALKNFQRDEGLEVEEEINEKIVNKVFTAESTTDSTSQESKSTPKQTTQTQEKKTISKKVQKVPEEANYAVSELITVAKQHIGTPYIWGGTTPNGFDCSGYIKYIFKKLGIQLPRTVSEIWNITKPVNNLSVGDFVFYQTYKPGPSHMGVYLGDGKFIHAGESRGVEISEMSDSYWTQRYLGAKRLTIQK
ncbi:NlpC/P60 family protein [Aquibacillus albus]|uniref:Cell wall-associated NlpC family hydrolase n=1 Tax=Aquibacillus albus TaxID=1168171 RepID=A0ABS2MW06_9BACI|nr:NlpC/P60 family protein [Aquibacillus albus]MBM7569880.1 cell wall-associated NlpC family hydrolase [Aquibacillus albus]